MGVARLRQKRTASKGLCSKTCLLPKVGITPLRQKQIANKHIYSKTCLLHQNVTQIDCLTTCADWPRNASKWCPNRLRLTAWAAWPRNASKCITNRPFWQLGRLGSEVTCAFNFIPRLSGLQLFACIKKKRAPKSSILTSWRPGPETTHNATQIVHVWQLGWPGKEMPQHFRLLNININAYLDLGSDGDRRAE